MVIAFRILVTNSVLVWMQFILPLLDSSVQMCTFDRPTCAKCQLWHEHRNIIVTCVKLKDAASILCQQLFNSHYSYN